MYRRVYFARHGQSTANAGEYSRKEADLLTSQGYLQAQNLAAGLDFLPALILTSQFKRAQETAHYITDHLNLPTAIIDPNLNEISLFDYKTLEGLSGDERRSLNRKYWSLADPQKKEGETDSFVDFALRIKKFQSQTMRTLPDLCLCIGHGTWIALLIWHLMGFKSETAEHMQSFHRFQLGLPLPNCALFEMTAIGNNWSIRYCSLPDSDPRF